MHGLTVPEILRIWEIGQTQQPFERALTILAVALPDVSGEEIAAYPIGRRNALLFHVRDSLFGERLRPRSECPACREWLEFTLSGADLGAAEAAERAATHHTLAIEGLELTFRLPDSHDLAASVYLTETEGAHAWLIRRCLIEPPTDPLSEPVLVALEEAMSNLDPLASILLDLTCPACGYSWSAPFDILTYFGEELSAFARQLLVEVATLARAFGWSENEILAMSATRRKFYLELIGS